MNKKKRIIFLSVIFLTISAATVFFYYKYTKEKERVTEQDKLTALINDMMARAADSATTVRSDTTKLYLQEENNSTNIRVQAEELNEIVPEKFIPKVLDYLNSYDGNSYNIIKYDQRKSANLYLQENFIQDHDGFALLVATSPGTSGGYTERLLVFSENEPGYISLVYSETFYNKVLLELVYPEPEKNGEGYDEIYMNTEVTTKPPHVCIRTIQQDEPDAIVIYDAKFDNIHKFMQKPASELQAVRGD